jgi:hypothetical protein
MNESDRFGVSEAALRPGKYFGSLVRSGAIAGVREIAFYCATLQNEYTGMKYRSRRSHQGRMQGRSCPEVTGMLEMVAGHVGDPSNASSG